MLMDYYKPIHSTGLFRRVEYMVINWLFTELVKKNKYSFKCIFCKKQVKLDLLETSVNLRGKLLLQASAPP